MINNGIDRASWSTTSGTHTMEITQAITHNGQYIYTYNVSTSGCYFKAGCYTQSNTSKGDASTAYGEVVIYSLSVKHE